VRLWIGVVTLACGVLLWFSSQRERGRVPPSIHRLALGVIALGLATLASTRPGMEWSVSAICFSLGAIVLLAWVLVDSLRK